MRCYEFLACNSVVTTFAAARLALTVATALNMLTI